MMRGLLAGLGMVLFVIAFFAVHGLIYGGSWVLAVRMGYPGAYGTVMAYTMLLALFIYEIERAPLMEDYGRYLNPDGTIICSIGRG